MEINFESINRGWIWYDFYEKLHQQSMLIYGIDAHSVEELEKCAAYCKETIFVK